MKLLKLVTMLTVVTFAMPAIALDSKQGDLKSLTKPYGLEVSSDSIFVATPGEVILTFISKTAKYSNDLFLVGSPVSILNNQTAVSGQQFSLGSFQAGAELAFNIFVNDTGRTFFNGIAANNSDKVVHAAYSTPLGMPVMVGFEDIARGGDKDFDDLVFSLSNVVISAIPISAVPEPETVAMFLAGLFAIGALKRRKAGQ